MESSGSSSASSPAPGSPSGKMQSKLPEGTTEKLQSLVQGAGSSSSSSPAPGSPNSNVQSKLPEGTTEKLQSLVKDAGSSSTSSSAPGSPRGKMQSKLPEGTKEQLESLVQKLDDSTAAKLLKLADEKGIAPIDETVGSIIIQEESTEPFVFKSVNEIYNLPLVQSAVGTVNKFYTGIKKSNCLCKLYLTGVEKAVNGVSMATRPCAQCLVYSPVGLMDVIAYKGITFIENQVPVLTLPTDQLIEDTKQYIERATRPCRRTIQKYVGGAIVALLPNDVILAQPARPGNGNDVTTGNDIPEDEQLPAPENN